MRYNQLFTIQTKITIPGDFSIRAGDMIDVTYDQLRAQDGKAAINTKTSGKYLVAHVCHSSFGFEDRFRHDSNQRVVGLHHN